MAIQERLYTADEVLALPHDSKRYALVEGHLIEMTPAGKEHGLVAGEVYAAIWNFNKVHKLGHVYAAETGFVVAQKPDTIYGVDVAFVSKARAQKGEGFYTGAPDLAVEVVSPSNTQIEMHDKVRAYFEGGAQLVWIFYPKSRTVYAYDSESSVKILHADDMLSGGKVLPGFEVKIADLFAVLDE